MLNLFFLSHWRYADDLSGVHGRMTDGRYHLPGTDCIYAYDNKVLAIMENHSYKTVEDVPGSLKIVEIAVPEESILELSPGDIPGWRDKPYNEKVRNYVHELLKKRDYLLIKVPSSEVPGEFLYIINARHPLMTEVKIIRNMDSSYPK
jgi:RES domain-containing protein